MKILNLYAGIGGNRKLWGNKHEITAVELNSSIASCYKDLYPNDEVVIGDAHDFLLNHYYEFDFIWASPPCQSHSRLRKIAASTYYSNPNKHNGTKPIYPDMKLWQEIIFLQHHFKKNWVVENVIPYYKPLIQPSFKLQRHLFWSNKFILETNFESQKIDFNSNGENEIKYEDISKYKFEGIKEKQVLRNCVQPELGKYIFEQVTGEKL